MPELPDLLDLDQQLCFALYRASRSLTRAYAPLLEPLGLTYPQYLVMLVLWRQDEIPVKEIGRQLALDSATLTPLLKRLEQQGIVRRQRDSDDERVVRIGLTDEGRALRERALRVPPAIACRLGFQPNVPGDLERLGQLRELLVSLGDQLDALPGVDPE